MKIMKKVLISLALASAFIGLGTANAEVKTSYKPNPRIISGKAAICIGTHESVNGEPEAKYACESLNNMGYIHQFLFLKPDYSDLIMLVPSLSATLSYNNVYFFVGHADSNRMHWGEYRTGTKRAGISIIENDTHENYNYVDPTFIGADLAIYMGCGTAFNSTNNLPKYGYNKGQKFTIGWSAEYIYDNDTDEWTRYFFDALENGKTIKTSINIANSYNYRNNSYMKSTVTFGSDKSLKSAKNTNSEFENKVYLKNSAELNNTSGVEYIRKNFDNNFNEEDYYLETTSNDEQTIYTYSLKINGVKTNIGYTIIKNNINNDVEIIDNFQNKELTEMKNISKLSKSNIDSINEKDLVMQALSKYTNSSENNATISYNSSQKYYDAIKDVLYFDVYLNSYDPISNTNLVLTESFKI